MKLGFFAIACILGLAMPVCCSAGTITLQFNELPPTPVNGVSIDGVTFGYSGPDGATATYGATAGVNVLTENLTDPVLLGDTSGTLTLAFAAPTTVLSFDIALSTTNSITDGYQVALTDQSNPVSSQEFNLSPIVAYAEDVFSYSGAAIDFATITFPNTVDSEDEAVVNFAIDNLTFDTSASSTPEPGTVSLLGGGLLALGFCARRRVRNRA
jgi:hypothetical protein